MYSPKTGQIPGITMWGTISYNCCLPLIFGREHGTQCTLFNLFCCHSFNRKMMRHSSRIMLVMFNMSWTMFWQLQWLQLPDLFTIQYAWDKIGQYLLISPQTTLSVLYQQGQEMSNNLPQGGIHFLHNYMHTRVQSNVNSQG